ncbi:iron-containing alcohol dehydrogenase [Alicyclobacillus ferrooxydans]|uniref:Alcohol dehydrogenase n=1 Tax=Alicyclobacillus ferrooxydans TaxID=471514 RepID=A0A0P9EAK2_9BACL|nr:iron-containing alcohol dehydrogenase [Alicyclobacillus ferrooxydans]KPV39364.1 alcohol dehydrogenase [Alicyclobacillus ferrooxydans]
MQTSLFQVSLRTTVTSGSGSRSLLPATVQGLGGRRAVLFTDKGLTNAGITQKITELFETMPGGVQLVGIFDEIEQDAKASIINKAVRYFKECSGDSLIALGGGSVLDTVKGVKWMMSKGLSDIRQGLLGNVLEMWPRAQYIPIPHVAIPTTAGTGAEVSPIAVIFHDEAQVKMNIINPFVNADIALLDPDLTVGLPPSITAFTGFDALTHAIEAYFSPQNNPMADAYAVQAARMVVENLGTAVKEGSNLPARANMLVASAMAISAFSLTLNAIPVHNMAHAFGAKFGIPHGLANAVLLPYVMRVLGDFYKPRIHGFAESIRLPNIPTDADACLQEVIAFLEQLREEVGLPSTFADFEMHPQVLEHMVEYVHADPSGLVFRLPDAVIQYVTSQVAGAPVPAGN